MTTPADLLDRTADQLAELLDLQARAHKAGRTGRDKYPVITELMTCPSPSGMGTSHNTLRRSVIENAWVVGHLARARRPHPLTSTSEMEKGLRKALDTERWHADWMRQAEAARRSQRAETARPSRTTPQRQADHPANPPFRPTAPPAVQMQLF